MSSNSQKLELRQGQSLVMTPQLQQSLKLLQYSTQELAEYIEAELQKNPLLAKKDSSADDEKDPDLQDETKDSALSDTDSFDRKNINEKTEAMDISPESDSDSEQQYESYQGESASSYQGIKSGGGQDFDWRESYLEQIPSQKKTLREHILDQINLDFSDPAKKIIAAHLLDMLDENGYIEDGFSHLEELLGCKDLLIKEVLDRLQKCDPPGIFARSLSECLALQLKDKNRFDPAMESLINNLELVAKGDFTKLQKICGVDKDDISEMCKEIRSLNPKPGNNFVPEIVHEIQADVFVKKSPDGKWILELNNDTLPKLLVNGKYYSEIKKKTRNEHEKKYLSEQYNTANWLVKTLHQRAETILKVATEIVKQQEKFFEEGIYSLKPMILKNISAELDIHESTVARVTTNKYISTSRGLYEMKFFFSSSIQNSSGDDDYSSKAVKHVIFELIEKEEPNKILSDDKLTEILNDKGINVARRTVAKYRESMHIPSSVQRRHKKKMQG